MLHWTSGKLDLVIIAAIRVRVSKPHTAHTSLRRRTLTYSSKAAARCQKYRKYTFLSVFDKLTCHLDVSLPCVHVILRVFQVDHFSKHLPYRPFAIDSNISRFLSTPMSLLNEISSTQHLSTSIHRPESVSISTQLGFDSHPYSTHLTLLSCLIVSLHTER